MTVKQNAWLGNREQRRWIDNAGKRRITSILPQRAGARAKKTYVYCRAHII
jgi:hypothetical protein